MAEHDNATEPTTTNVSQDVPSLWPVLAGLGAAICAGMVAYVSRKGWTKLVLAGYAAAVVACFPANAEPLQEPDESSPEAARQWAPETQAALLPILGADFIARGFGIHAGEYVDVNPNLRFRVPDGMLVLAQPYADFFLEKLGIEGHPKSYAIAMSWDGNHPAESVEKLVQAEGVALIRVEDTGHIKLSDPDFDKDELMGRYQRAFAATAGAYGVDVLRLRWDVPPILNEKVPSLEWDAKIEIQDAGRPDILKLPTVVLFGKTFVVRLEYLSPSRIPNALLERGSDVSINRLRVLANHIEIAKGYEYGAFRAGDDKLSKQYPDELIAPREYERDARKYKRIANYFYLFAAAASILGILTTKLYDARKRRIRRSGIDAIGYFKKVEWRPHFKKQEAVWFEIDLQMPDGSAISVKRMLVFESHDAEQFKDKIADGKPCEVKLDPKKHSRFVLVACSGLAIPG
jgi:hypothetical protein